MPSPTAPNPIAQPGATAAGRARVASRRTRASGVLGAAVVVAIGLALWSYWRSGPDIGPSPAPAAPPDVAAPAAAAGPASSSAPAVGTADLERGPAAPEAVRVAAPPAADFPQGLRGLVLDEADQPLAGIDVYLLESPSNDLVALPLLLQQRHLMGPLSSARTKDDGTFAISLQMVQDKVYELRVVSPRHATARLGGLRLLQGEWHDVGAITLVPGATLRGRVTVEGRADIPVPQAVVTVEAGTAFEDVAQRSLPGQERGLSTTVDANGFYELRHAPSRGVVQVSAVAPGFARVLRPNIELSTTHPIELDFGLPPGQSVAGQIVDGNDRPVAGARIEAWAQQGTASALLGHSDSSGRFDVLGMRALPHRLRVSARGFQTQDVPDVQPGRDDLRIVLQARGTVRVRVLTPEGAVLRSYQLSLRRYFEEQGGQIGLVVDVPEQRVRLDGMTDFAELRGVPNGTFKCQVVADGYAKTFSAPITFPISNNEADTAAAGGDGEVQTIDVRLSSGATLRGRVFDEAGRPLGGATVTTQADGATPDNPLTKMLAGGLPDKITPQRATTDADGSFVLTQLALADYQLEVTHPDACRTIVPGLRLDTVGLRTLPAIRMLTGAVVAGRATVGGRVAGQIKVVLATDATGDGAADRDALRLETVTDAEGHFEMPRRVPPGSYVLRAAVVGTAEPEAQIFQQLLQMRRSSTPIAVLAGAARIECNIDLPTDH